MLNIQDIEHILSLFYIYIPSDYNYQRKLYNNQLKLLYMNSFKSHRLF